MTFIGYVILIITIVSVYFGAKGLFRIRAKANKKVKFSELYGGIFMILALGLYFVTLTETYENLEIGDLTFGSFFINFPSTIVYFFESVASFWALYIAPLAVVLAFAFRGVRKLVQHN